MLAPWHCKAAAEEKGQTRAPVSSHSIKENNENEMMTLSRNVTLSVLGFGIVLFVAILYTATFSHTVEYTEVEDFGDSKLDSSISNLVWV